MKSEMRFIKSAVEYRSIDELSMVPNNLRGFYSLYHKKGNSFNMVYVGMSGKEARGRIKKRLLKHRQTKSTHWTHFSYFEVWDNVSDLEIFELEGLFRQLYRFDLRANSLNKQQTHRPLTKVRKATEKHLGLKAMTKKSLGI